MYDGKRSWEKDSEREGERERHCLLQRETSWRSEKEKDVKRDRQSKNEQQREELTV